MYVSDEGRREEEVERPLSSPCCDLLINVNSREVTGSPAFKDGNDILVLLLLFLTPL